MADEEEPGRKKRKRCTEPKPPKEPKKPRKTAKQLRIEQARIEELKNAPPPPSFLKFVEEHRAVVVQAHAKLTHEQTVLDRLEAVSQFALDWREKQRLREEIVRQKRVVLSLQCISPDNFDQLVSRYMDQFHAKHNQAIDPRHFKVLTEADLIDALKSDLGIGVSDPKRRVRDADSCPHCGTECEAKQEEATLQCPACTAITIAIDATADNMAYGDDLGFQQQQTHANKSIQRFQEKFGQWLGMRTPAVTDALVRQVSEKLLEMGHVSLATVTWRATRDAMKACKMKNRFDHTTQIWLRVIGRPPLRVSPAAKERIQTRYTQFPTPFEKVKKRRMEQWEKESMDPDKSKKPVKRKSALTLAFHIYKVATEYGYDDLLYYCNLLKSFEKLRESDLLYKEVCEEDGWDFKEITEEAFNWLKEVQKGPPPDERELCAGLEAVAQAEAKHRLSPSTR